MVQFANPSLLWLAPLAILISLWWGVRPRPRLRYSHLKLVENLPSGRSKRVIFGGAAIRGLAAVLLVVACAGPRRPDLQTRLPVEGIAILMVLDISGSMAERDVVWPGEVQPISRLEAAQRSFRLFVAGGTSPDGTAFAPRSTDLIGLVTFAAVPRTACPLTLNHSVLLRILDEQTPREGLDAGTNVGDALAEGLLRLESAGPRPKVMILLSDGEHNVFRDGPMATLMPRQAAQLAANLGIRIYTIDSGGEPSANATPDEREQRLTGQAILQSIAEMTGGKAFTATQGADLLAAYREIERLEKRTVLSYSYRRYHEYAPWFAGLALLLIAGVFLMDRTTWRRLP